VIETVLDTNTLAAGAVATGRTIGEMIDAWLVDNSFAVVLSDPILIELARVLQRPYFTRRLSQADLADFRATVRRSATIVAITAPVPTVLRTRGDNLVLATAASAAVPYVVTGDQEMLRLRSYQGITIMHPRQWMSLLRQPGGTQP
jgi:putative PIN family toxin of toxin-antitoxin system